MVGTATAPAKNGDKQAVMPRSFICGSRKNDKGDYDSGSVVFTTAEQRLQAYQIAPSGYLRGVYLTVTNVTAGNAAAVAFNENGPFNALSVIRFLDTNSRPFIGTLTGYDVMILNKYGGYTFQGDPKASAVYSATTGVGAGLGGSFTFVLYLPLEIMVRNALGSQLNKSGAAQFALEMFMAATATVFSVAPTNAGSLRVRSTLMSWLDPEDTDARGNPVQQEPPYLNTTQRWEKQAGIPISAGERTLRLSGIDGLVRMMILINYRSASTRLLGETDFPDPISLKYEESFLIQSRIRALYHFFVAQHYGYAAANEAATGRDNGVYPVWEFMQDFERKPGNELTRTYLPMSSASNLELSGNWVTASTLDVLVNKVVPFPQGELKGLAVL